MTDRSAASRWQDDPLSALLPLRVFLGVVFLYAGLSKIADTTFLDDSSPLSMHASVVAVKAQSPIGALLGPVVDHSAVFGLLMAVGEIAVGIGTLAGLLHRIAAAGGVVLALSLFLTVSWGADPWYTGADLGYAVAFVPLLLSRATPWSADAWLAEATRRRLADDTDTRLVTSEDRTRRGILTGIAALTGLVVAAGAALARGRSTPRAGRVAAESRSAPPGTSTTVASSSNGASSSPTTAASTPPTVTPAVVGKTLARTADVPVGGGKQADDPVTGQPVWVLQLEAGQFTALSAACPHQGCAVNFVSASTGFVCPCHRSTFSATGAVQKGPAASNLAALAVRESGGVITLS